MKSAKLDHAEGTYNNGYCYYKGIEIEIDKHKEFEYYMKSAELGNLLEYIGLEVFMKKEQELKKMNVKAFEYYLKSADMGNVNGIYDVGRRYDNGLVTKIIKRKPSNII